MTAGRDFPHGCKNASSGSVKISRTEIVTNVGGFGKSCCGIVIPIGVNSERGLIATACGRSDFPDQIDRQLLSVAANNAATAFQNAHLINELRNAQKALCDHCGVPWRPFVGDCQRWTRCNLSLHLADRGNGANTLGCLMRFGPPRSIFPLIGPQSFIL